MPPPVADDDHKRRARRRLIGAVALTILAIIILPLVLEDKPPPAGPLEVHMPQTPQAALPQNSVEYAAPAPSAMPEPEEPAKVQPVQVEAKKEPPDPAPKPVVKPADPPSKPAANSTQKAPAYTVQVGVFADKANVQKLQAQISRLGLKSYTDAMDGSTRVRIGTFKERSDADTTLAKLTAAGIKGQVVEK